MANRDIAELKTFKFRMIGAIKSAPINSAYKADIIAEIDNISMPLAIYQRKPDEITWSTFVGKVCYQTERVLLNKGVNPVIISQIKDYIVKVKR